MSNEDNELKMIIPKNTKDLRACQQCGLILTQDQWNKEKECPNECNASYTKLFSGMVCIMKPKQSWVLRRLGNPDTIHPGLYALDVQAD